MTKQTDPDEEVFVRFTGMKAAGVLSALPALGGRIKFAGEGQFNKDLHHELMADGHHRAVVGVKVIEVELGEITPAPEGDPTLPYDEDAEEIG